MFFNLKRGKPFDDIRFRQALCYAVPKEQIKEEIYQGLVTPGASVIAPVNKFWHNENLKPYPYDPEKTKQMLKAAGYQWDKKGRLCFPAN
jgi:ABC-type transport system substrate-binding protein